MKFMTRSELISAISLRFPQLGVEDVELAARTILNAMTQSLSRGSRIEIRGFGSFSLNHCAPRIGRNPKTGHRVDIPAKAVPHFKPGRELVLLVDRQRNPAMEDKRKAA
jgi:integration host factor subunit beta